MHPCPVCREPLPNEHWRVLADHAACQRPVPSAPKADHLQESGGVSLVTQGINRLRKRGGGSRCRHQPKHRY